MKPIGAQMLALSVALGCGIKVHGDTNEPTGNFPCETVAECPAPKKACLLSACLDEQCVFMPAPPGVLPAEDQRVGDCRMLYCDGDGKSVVDPAPGDAPDEDENPCTVASCEGDKPHQEPSMVGTKCGQEGMCNGAGKCGECMPGNKTCDGAAVIACTREGAWSPPAVCPVDKPLCSAAKCIGVVDAAVGAKHACARFDDGTVRCWGGDDYGQLGQNGVDGAFTPSWASGFTKASFGLSHACGRRADGTIWCWGVNSYGQLGDGTYDSSSAPVATGVSGLDVAVGDYMSCALTDGGKVQCWGRSDHGQLGMGKAPAAPLALEVVDPSNAPQNRPVLVPGLADAVELSLGAFHTCVRRANGARTCWGYETFTIPEPPTSDDGSDPLAEIKKLSQAQPQPIAGLQDAAQIACAANHCCVRMVDGTARCWGSGTRGELGNGATADSFKPVPVKGLANARHIALGRHFGCALLAEGSIACWGDNELGQLGSGSDKTSNVAATIATLGKARTLHVGEDFACALLEGGELHCWGSNLGGQLGRDDVDQAKQPASVRW